MRRALVLPTRIRRRTLRHAFEDALEDARDSAQVDGDALEGGNGSLNLSHNTNHLSGLPDDDAYVGPGLLAAAYAAEMDPQAAREAFDPRLAALKVDRALLSPLSVTELKRLRRRFAAQNHPDRVPTELRDAAAKAMADVNAKIDRALLQARRNG
ncbi:MAG: hypothetical protein WC807_07750 [Hyphomicrobium sp.]|jgi:hypothetical protein